MPSHTSKDLFKVAGIVKEIERLREQLEALFQRDEVREVPSRVRQEKSVTRAKQKGTKIWVGSARKSRAAAVPDGRKVTGPVVGQSTRGMRNGSLAQAVREVLSASKKPLNVAGICEALNARNYVLPFADSKRGLGVRMYRIKGVKALGAGMFSAA
jgi:hypothetical protein